MDGYSNIDFPQIIFAVRNPSKILGQTVREIKMTT